MLLEQSFTELLIRRVLSLLRINRLADFARAFLGGRVSGGIDCTGGHWVLSRHRG
jgi:hypothetical protein